MSENVICRKTQDDLIGKFNSPPLFSVVIPTLNESENIVRLINEIKAATSENEAYELIIVDDNSPDDTVGMIINDFTNQNGFKVYKIRQNIGLQSHQYYLIYPEKGNRFYIKVIKRNERSGLISAIYEGFKSSIGEYVLVMDADFSHSPTHINKLINEIRSSDSDLVIASRYLKGGKIIGWSPKRIFLSRFATNLSKLIFGLSEVSDPMSGFFIVKRKIIRKMHFSTSGFKILLEILVKSKNLKINEIPYTFSDRAMGASKLNSKVTIDFFKGLYTLYKARN
ncbi:polyprenol monophosphomannose synthase [Candidatus Nitrosocosmicus hydrocola]|uniref:polyprenol monophosphomannose synthase n=1 Tax=Candidatus Nitrosocosmicus hydrocola TaxID=1826872 RepID=UPI000B1CD291|nr:polyprenol monophosphomannose synthase [Candidatus Nitrosocosmicus hydrocola]